MSKYRIGTFNGISEVGLEKFGKEYQISDKEKTPDGIILRSASLHEMDFPESLLCIARAGAGVNNIPIEKCAENGIVVFNTPGANANAVKELAISSLFLSSRKIIDGINWTRSLSGNDVKKQVENGKSQFIGPEISHKKLGVIGLGAIGVMVANAAVNLDMEVYGYDPYISIEHAWGMSRAVKKAEELSEIFKYCDYITLHIPLTDSTKEILDKEAFSQMKKGVRIINLSRGELVNTADILEALDKELVSNYVTDFPNETLIKNPNVIPIPHLGASTPESENNCAVMAVLQTKDFLENGNIKNAVNFPNCDMGICQFKHRLTIIHKNIPKMLGQISAILSEQGINIANLINRSRGDYAYTMMDLEEELSADNIKQITEIAGVLKVRII